MEGVLFTFLLVGTGIGVGLAGVAAWMHFKLAKLTNAEHRASGIIKVGLVIIDAILLERLAEVRSSVPNIWSWGFLVGLIVITIGLGMQVKDLILELAKAETNDA